VLPLLLSSLIWAGCCSTKSAPARTAASAAPAVHVAAAAKAPGAPPPATPEGCRACNGLWAKHGIATEESCDCRTSDGGKRCRDGADCQGMCLAAENAEREVVEAGPPARGFFVGRCSDLVTVFGCNRIIDRGAAASGPAVLGEPPQMICVD